MANNGTDMTPSAARHRLRLLARALAGQAKALRDGGAIAEARALARRAKAFNSLSWATVAPAPAPVPVRVRR